MLCVWCWEEQMVTRAWHESRSCEIPNLSSMYVAEMHRVEQKGPCHHSTYTGLSNKLPKWVSHVPLPTKSPRHWGRQLKSQQNEGICGSTERSEVLLNVLSVILTLQLAPEAVNKSDCKAAGFEVGIGLCSPMPTITKLYGSVLTSFLCHPNFVLVI